MIQRLLMAFALSLTIGASMASVAGSEATRSAESPSQIIGRCDTGLADVLTFVRARPELFTKDREGLLTLEEKREIWGTWKRFLEYELALESLRQASAKYYRLDGREEIDTFFAHHYASVVQYRYALEFLDLTSGNSAVQKLLNEVVPDVGLDADSFSKFKFRFLNAGRGIEFAARQVVFAAYSRKQPPPNPAIVNGHTDRIWEMGRGRGQQMTLKNAAGIVRRAGANAWLPIQTGVSEWMGDTKVRRPKRYLITEEQIERLELQPGDIMIQRRDWYVSNIGLPGFWPHTAIYIGTPAERQKFFDDPQVHAWVIKCGEPSGNFETLLRTRYANAYQWSGRTENGDAYRVLEAISEGVIFTTLEHSAAADSMAVLRPRRSKKEKAAALERAFGYVGRPYDFNFDFDTDASLVCTELVCKSYEPSADSTGLQFPVEKMLGRKVVPANLIVRDFDESYGTPKQQLELVHFFDANERSQRSVPSTLDAFRGSWRRPKWHILLQNR